MAWEWTTTRSARGTPWCSTRMGRSSPSRARVWQGVASVVLGPSALQGGFRTVLVGVALHLCVAFTWTAVFLGLALLSERLRAIISTPGGVLAVAVAYGPLVWIVMSTLIIP